MDDNSNKNKKLGQQPGAVIFTGERKVERVGIHYLEYNEGHCKEQELDNQSITAFHAPVEEFVQWYDVRGLHDTALIEEFGKVFRMHPLALEDIADTSQRPKLDEYSDGVLITLRALHFNAEERLMKYEHIAVYLGGGYVLSFQESGTDLFSGVRTRIMQQKGRIRMRGADYLAYALMDAIVDKYYLIIDELELTIDQMETTILQNPDRQLKGEIHNLKQELLLARRSVAPLREVVHSCNRLGNQLISDSTLVFFRDLGDHVAQVSDLIETQRDMINSLHDLYLSELSFQMNNVMQVLTILSAIFIPLSFLTGLYGMNFHHMPELQWQYGYFYVLGLMGLMIIAMLWYFRKKQWL